VEATGCLRLGRAADLGTSCSSSQVSFEPVSFEPGAAQGTSSVQMPHIRQSA